MLFVVGSVRLLSMDTSHVGAMHRIAALSMEAPILLGLAIPLGRSVHPKFCPVLYPAVLVDFGSWLVDLLPCWPFIV